MLVKTDSPLDKITDGGFYPRRLYEIFGEFETGKSTIALQACSLLAKEGHKSLYLDAEVHWQDREKDSWLGFFSKRFEVDKAKLEDLICFKYLPNPLDFFNYFGFTIQVILGEKKCTILWQFPKRNKADIKESKLIRGWLQESPIWKDLEKEKYSFIVIDSWACLIKSLIPYADQNLGTRSSFTNFFLQQCLKPIALEFKIPILVTNHGRGFRGSVEAVEPYGGSGVGHLFKYQIALTKITNKTWNRLQSKVTDEVKKNYVRLAYIRRDPTKTEDDVKSFCYLYLKKDYGFTSLPYKKTGRVRVKG